MCDCNCNCCCWSYKPSGKGCGGWLVLWLVLLVFAFLPGGWLLLGLGIVAFWKWWAGGLLVLAALRWLGSLGERAPERAPEHDPDCNYRWACENYADYQSCNCRLAKTTPHI